MRDILPRRTVRQSRRDCNNIRDPLTDFRQTIISVLLFLRAVDPAGLTGLGQPQLGPAADGYSNHRRLQNLEHVGRADADA